MQTLQKTLDLEEERDELQDRVGDLEEEIEDRVDEAMEYEESEGSDANVTEELQRLENQVDELEALLALSRGRLNVLDRAIEEWGGTEVTFREITGAESRKINAQAQQRAEQAGVEYTSDFHESLLLQHATVSTPPGCPDPSDIGDLPDRLFDLFVARANTLNSVGEFEMGNSSLRERMMDRREEEEDQSSTQESS